jgi:hypothetical protein
MKYLHFIMRQLGAGLALIAVCLLISCNDEPTKPKPAKQYLAYFYDAERPEQNWYFVYDALDFTIDSVLLPYGDYPVISADGNLMYIRNRVSGVIDIIEVDSFTVVGSLPYQSPIDASPNGRWLAVYDSGIHILKTSDNSSVFYDSILKGDDYIFGGHFSPSSSAFYGLPKSGHIRRIDLTDDRYATEDIYVPFGFVFDMAIAPDESKLYLSLQRGSAGGAFAVLERSADSLIFVDPLWPGFASVAVRPDGNFVFYSHPDWFSGPTPGDPWLNVYDVQDNSRPMRINTIGPLDPPYDTIGVPLGQLCMPPDGRRLVALPSKGAPLVYSIDPVAMKILSVWKRTSASSFEGLSCQSGR